MTDKKTNNPVTDKELEALRTYRSRSGLALSAYLDLRSNYHREIAEDVLEDMVQSQLQKLGVHEEDQELLQEDLELVRLYLNTSGNRKVTGVAIFSCAEELFWRAYPLPTPVDVHVHIGPKLDVEPLLDRATRSHADMQAEQLVV